MEIKVELRARDDMPQQVKDQYKVGFEHEGYREVTVPDHEVPALDPMILNYEENVLNLLEKVWFYGQNDFQPKQHRSLMVGDIAVVNGNRYRVENIGWKKLPALN